MRSPSPAPFVIRPIDPLFAASAERVKVSKTTLLIRYGASSWAVAHDFGVLVFVGVEPSERESVIAKLLAGCEPPDAQPLVESFGIEVEPGRVPAAHFDRVVLPGLDARNVELIALAIGQSVGMEYYEGQVDELIVQLERASRRLADTGRLSDRNRALLRFIGRGMAMRTQVVHTLSLLDAPALAWDDEGWSTGRSTTAPSCSKSRSSS